MTRRRTISCSLGAAAALAVMLAGAPAPAQTIPPERSLAALNVPTDPLCQPLRDCARATLPQLDDMTSAPDAISARVAPQCEAQMIACNDAVTAGSQQQIAADKMANADQLNKTLTKPESRVMTDKALIKTVLNVEVDLHRYQVTGQVPADATSGHVGPAKTPTP